MADTGGEINPPQPSTSTSIPSTSTETPSSSSNESDGKNQSSPQPPLVIEYKAYDGSMSDYCKQLENWLGRAYWQRECAVSAYYTALNVMYPWNRNSGGGLQAPNGYSPNAIRTGNNIGNNIIGMNNNNNFAEPNLNMPNQANRQIFFRGIRANQNTLYFDFVIAPIWKRLLAECIDFFILLIVKLFVTLTVIENFDLINLDNLDLDALQQAENLLDLALTLSWELFILEMTHRILVCFFEAYCLARGGSTPGKRCMNLRVLHCQQVIPIPVDMYQNNNLNVPLFPGGFPRSRVLVIPGSNLSFQRAFLRSMIKNFSLATFFPFCFTLFHFEYNRTMYDLAAKSIVVEIRQW